MFFCIHRFCADTLRCSVPFQIVKRANYSCEPARKQIKFDQTADNENKMIV